jgi:iron complex outermembrane recepter protein
MTNQSSRITKTGLAASVAWGALGMFAFATSAHAQTPSVAPAQTPEVVVVTGSRIAGQATQGISPVQIVTGEAIRNSAGVDVDQILKELSQFAPSTGQTTSPALLESHGASTLDMRGLGQNRTLVLVNGQRATPNGFRNSVDINTIPSTLIKRIETLTGGAAAVYGADAVAGVTNFILNDSYQGLEVTFSGNTSEQNDATNYTVGITGGLNFFEGRGNITAHVAYTDRGELLRGDRDWAKNEVNDLGLPFGGPFATVGGNFTRATAGGNFNLTSVGGPASSNTIFFPTSGSPRNTNPNEPLSFKEAFINGNERQNAALFAKFEFNKHFEVFGRYQYAVINNKSWALPVNSASHASAASFVLRSDNPYINTPALSAIFSPLFLTGARNATDTAAAPNGPLAAGEVRSVRLNVTRIMDEFGLRNDYAEREMTQLVLGFKGEITKNIGYEFNYIDGKNTETVDRENAGVATRLSQAANVTVVNGQAACVDPSNGCVPINLFGAGSVSAAAAEWVGGGRFFFNQRNREQKVMSLAVSGTTEDFFSLPAGPIGFSIGVESRDEWGNTLFGDRARLAQTMAAGATGFRLPQSAAYDLVEGFGELRVPILADLPFIKRLEFEGAYRKTEHSQAGEYETSKVGATWSITDDLRLRGSQQTVVRGANLGELFNLIAFPTYTGTRLDPCSNPTVELTTAEFCALAGAPTAPYDGTLRNLVTTPQGGDPNMQPETGETVTYGFVYTPKFIEGLSMVVDYYKISIDNAISGISADDRLTICYRETRDINSPVCQSIRRDPTTKLITEILTADTNIASLSTSGTDFSIYYNAKLPSALPGDRINISFTGTMLESFQRKADPRPTTLVFDCAGRFGGAALGSGACTDSGLGTRAQPDFRSTLNVAWSAKKLTIRGAWRYFGETDILIPNANLVQHISPWDYFDLGASYRINDNLRVSGSITNVFDKLPPVLGSNQSDANTLPNQYDIIGRRYGINLVWKM